MRITLWLGVLLLAGCATPRSQDQAADSIQREMNQAAQDSAQAKQTRRGEQCFAAPSCGGHAEGGQQIAGYQIRFDGEQYTGQPGVHVYRVGNALQHVAAPRCQRQHFAESERRDGIRSFGSDTRDVWLRLQDRQHPHLHSAADLADADFSSELSDRAT